MKRLIIEHSFVLTSALYGCLGTSLLIFFSSTTTTIQLTTKLGWIIWLRKIIQKYSFCYSVPESGQNRPAYSLCIQDEYLFNSQIMSNNVKYWKFLDIFGHFRAICTCFLHFWTLTNKERINICFKLTFLICTK